MLRLFSVGCGERFKGGYHGAIGILAIGACAYNLLAWLHRKDRHLAVNVAIYGSLTAYEIHLIGHHRRRLSGV